MLCGTVWIPVWGEGESIVEDHYGTTGKFGVRCCEMRDMGQTPSLGWHSPENKSLYVAGDACGDAQYQIERMPSVYFNLLKQSCCCCCEVASVVSDSVRPHRRQPTRPPRPWGSPGNSTGGGCHCLLRKQSRWRQTRPKAASERGTRACGWFPAAPGRAPRPFPWGWRAFFLTPAPTLRKRRPRALPARPAFSSRGWGPPPGPALPLASSVGPTAPAASAFDDPGRPAMSSQVTGWTPPLGLDGTRARGGASSARLRSAPLRRTLLPAGS